MVVVSQHCTTCGDNAFSWRSQPLILRKYPAGNMLLSFGVLMAGASISKVLLVMRHMGLCAYSGKAMIKLSKEKGCEKIGDWVKGVRNHLYWCGTSTKQGFQELIAAKWQSFMQHVANKHDGHPTPIFKKCAHEEIGSRRWIKIGREKCICIIPLLEKLAKFSVKCNSNGSRCTLFPVHSPHLSPLQTYLYACRLTSLFTLVVFGV